MKATSRAKPVRAMQSRARAVSSLYMLFVVRVW